MKIQPKLDILPPAQKELWPQLKDTPKQFVLYGGTAIALRYGHRVSEDFDFFSTKQFDIKKTVSDIPYVKNTENAIFRQSEYHVDYLINLKAGQVKVTFLNRVSVMPGCINAPDLATDNNIKIASPLDLMAGKIFALQARSKDRDYHDLGELIKNGVSLQRGFEAAHAIAKLALEEHRQKTPLKALAERLNSLTVNYALPKHPELVKLIKHEARWIDFDQVNEVNLKVKKDLAYQPELSR